MLDIMTSSTRNAYGLVNIPNLTKVSTILKKKLRCLQDAENKIKDQKRGSNIGSQDSMGGLK